MRRLLLLLLLPVGAHAQPGPSTEFPADVALLTAEALRERLGGKVFDARLADGTGWRIDYKSTGYVFFDTTKGFRDDGRWHTDASRVCIELRKVAGGCSEMREKDGRLYMKRSSTGEVLVLTLR